MIRVNGVAVKILRHQLLSAKWEGPVRARHRLLLLILLLLRPHPTGVVADAAEATKGQEFIYRLGNYERKVDDLVFTLVMMAWKDLLI